MSDYLALAIHREGTTDYRFLGPLLLRAAEEICSTARRSIQVSETLTELRTNKREPTEQLRVESAVQSQTSPDFVIFIHADGSGDWRQAYNNHVGPVASTLVDKLGFRREQIVGVVPVREMEAWALVCGDTIRKVFNTDLKDGQLGLSASSPAGVENITDPKKELNNAYNQVLGRRVVRRSSRRETAASFLAELGREVPIKKLRLVPSFQRFEDDLRKALVALGYLETR